MTRQLQSKFSPKLSPKLAYRWTGAAGSISVLMSGLPIAEAVEVMEPYTPPTLQPFSFSRNPQPSLAPASAAPSSLPTFPQVLPQVLPEALSDSLPQNPVGLSFDLPSPDTTVDLAIVAEGESTPESLAAGGNQQNLLTQQNAEFPADWWRMGSDSPIAIAIGMAEGTRTVDGGKTAAYYWHEDPGNGANNFGTFSYQHLAPHQTQEVDRQASGTAKREVAKEQGLPELSDRLQLERLQKFHAQLQQQARAKGIQLTTLEALNGLDLANQSEAAALSAWGYIDRLAQMRSLLPGEAEEQIREARAWSYWSPSRNTWDAPGLGNHYSYIRKDQDRRFAAIQKALKTYAVDVSATPHAATAKDPALPVVSSQSPSDNQSSLSSQFNQFNQFNQFTQADRANPSTEASQPPLFTPLSKSHQSSQSHQVSQSTQATQAVAQPSHESLSQAEQNDRIAAILSFPG